MNKIAREAALSGMKLAGELTAKIAIHPKSRTTFSDSEKEFFNGTDLEGYVILTRVNYQLSNYFIEGYWEHVQGVSTKKRIVEATTHGVEVKTIFEGLQNKHDYIVLKPFFADKDERHAAAEQFLTYEGAAYDFNFLKTNKNKYCSEIPWLGYEHILGDKNVFTPRKMMFLGEEVEYIQPVDFYRANKKWEIVFRCPVGMNEGR